MKKLIAAILASALMVPAASYAQGAQQREYHAGENHAAQQTQSSRSNGENDRSDNRNAAPNRQSNSNASANANTSARSSHKFTNGERFERSRAQNYRRVNHAENKRLSAPRSGYVWVRSGSDALLVRLSNNIVSQVVSNVF